MLKYSFMSSYTKATREETEKFIQETNKPFKYTYGFKYRHPTTYLKPIDREAALKYFKERGRLIDVEEKENYVDINEYSSNDMW